MKLPPTLQSPGAPHDKTCTETPPRINPDLLSDPSPGISIALPHPCAPAPDRTAAPAPLAPATRTTSRAATPARRAINPVIGPDHPHARSSTLTTYRSALPS